jgi:hypothetical protein
LKTATAFAALVIALVPMSVSAKPAKKATPTTYECSKCHMTFTAAQAKKDHYKDPMDGGKLVPVKAAKPAAKPMGGMKPASDAPMGGMKM